MTIPAFVQEILCQLEAEGFSAHCVGGCVRDALLDRTPHDWDVTTSALPEEVLRLFGDRCIPTGLRHGTVTVKTAGGGVEVTTHRKDGAYLDNRRPESVDFSASLEEDLARRDFTINAMAMDRHGALTDPFGGQEDLLQRRLRCVGDPEARFREDGLRVIRGLRFAAQLDFALEAETAAAVMRCRGLLRHIAAERLEVELTKLLCGLSPLPVLLDYPAVIGVVIPEILPAVGFDQRNRHHCYDVWEHTVRALAAVPQDPVLRWTMLLHDLGKPAAFTVDSAGQGHFYGHGEISCRLAQSVTDRLRMARSRQSDILELVRWHDLSVAPTAKSVRRALNRFGPELLRLLFAVQRADNLAQHPAFRDKQAQLDQAEALMEEICQAGDCFTLDKLAVNGRDVSALGLQGKAVGAALQALLEAVMEERLPNERQALLDSLEKIKETL